MNSRDLIRVTVQCPELDYPISLPFMRAAQLSADRLLSEIERMLSYEEFVVDQSLAIEVIQVKMPHGKGYKKKSYESLKSRWKKREGSSRLSTETIYAVLEPLWRPNLELPNIQNGIR